MLVFISEAGHPGAGRDQPDPLPISEGPGSECEVSRYPDPPAWTVACGCWHQPGVVRGHLPCYGGQREGGVLLCPGSGYFPQAQLFFRAVPGPGSGGTEITGSRKSGHQISPFHCAGIRIRFWENNRLKTEHRKHEKGLTELWSVNLVRPFLL